MRGVTARVSVSLEDRAKQYLLEGRQALHDYYKANPEVKKLLNGYGGTFRATEDGVSFLARHSKPFTEEEERLLSFHLWRLRRILLRLMIRREYFYHALDDVKKEVLSGERDIYSVFEWENIAKSKDFMEKKEEAMKEAFAVFKRDRIKGLGALARAVRSLSLRWSVVVEIAKKRGGRLEKLIAETIREIEHLFVFANMKLVPYCLGILRRWESEVDYDDLVTEGVFALYRAIDKFDYGKGCKFSTYAMWWIRQYVTRAIYELSRRVKLPVGIQEKIAQMTKVGRELEMELERPPSDRELARELGLPLEDVVRLKAISQDALSLDVPAGEGEDSDPLVERIRDDKYDPETIVTSKITREVLMEILDKRLNYLEKEVILARMGFYAGETEALESIARRFGRTRSWAKRVEERALQKLRVGEHSAVLRSFFEAMD